MEASVIGDMHSNYYGLAYTTLSGSRCSTLVAVYATIFTGKQWSPHKEYSEPYTGNM